jgi:hypothetical protein
MPTLREELEPLRRLVKGGNYAALKAMIEFIAAAGTALPHLCRLLQEHHQAEHAELTEDCSVCYGLWEGRELLALLDQQIE